MKKIIILAVIACTLIGWGSFCSPTIPNENPGCPVWYLQVSMKTLVPQRIKVKSGNVGTVCSPGNTETSNCVAFTLGTRNFAGGWWDCSNLCDKDATVKHALKRGDNFILWEQSTGVAVTKPLEVNTSGDAYVADSAQWAVLDRFGAKGEYVEGYINIPLVGGQVPDTGTYANYRGAFAGVLTLAGAGLWEDNKVKVMQGYATALWRPECDCSGAWNLCDEFTNWCDVSNDGFISKSPAAVDGENPPIAMLPVPSTSNDEDYSSEHQQYVAGAGVWTLRYYDATSSKKSIGDIVPPMAKK